MRGLGWFPAKLVQRVIEQQGATIPEILSSDEMAFMQQVFPQIRVAASFDHPNWASIGYPDGPLLSPVSYAAVRYVWPQIRVAADWSHPTWNLHRVPAEILAAAMPPPEAPPPPIVTTATPAPAPAPAPAPTGPTSPTFDYSPAPGPAPAPYIPSGPISYQPIPDDAIYDESGEPVKPVQAGMFGGLSLPMILTAAGAILFFSLARGAGAVRGTKPRRRRRR